MSAELVVDGEVVQHEEHGVTPAQAKVDAIANLTMKSYEKASQLGLSKEEQSALIKDFPDDAFRSGAGGNERLIYIEHAYLRERLNSVLGVGNWAIICRSWWQEDFGAGIRVYVEAMLLIRGCFVAESIGDMSYFKKNNSQNLADAIEGAKSAAFRRCAKELGVGLQAWKKDWCEGWWKRRSGTKQEERHERPVEDIKPEPVKPSISKGWMDAIGRADTEDKLQQLLEAFCKQNPDELHSKYGELLEKRANEIGH